MLDINEMLQEAQRLDKKGGNFLQNFVPMPVRDGTLLLRLLPPRKGQKFYCMSRTHRMGNQNLHCPKELKNGRWEGKCCICDEYNRLWEESKKKDCKNPEELQNRAGLIKPIERYYINCIIRSLVLPNQEVQRNVGPRILSVGKTVWKMVVRAIVGDEKIDEKPLGDITDLKSGRDFKLVKIMTQGRTGEYPSYHLSKFLEPSPAGNPDEVEKWLAELHDLQALRTLKPAEEMQHALDVFNGKAVDDSTEYTADGDEVVTSKVVSPTVEPVTPKIEASDVGDILADEEFQNMVEQVRSKK